MSSRQLQAQKLRLFFAVLHEPREQAQREDAAGNQGDGHSAFWNLNGRSNDAGEKSIQGVEHNNGGFEDNETFAARLASIEPSNERSRLRFT